MRNLGRMRWICTAMVTLIVVLGLESAALAYPDAPQATAPALEQPFAAAARISAPTPRLVRGPHLMAREAHRHVSLGGPVIKPPIQLATADPSERHLVAGTILTLVSIALLVNFLWMVIVGAIWFFAFYIPVASDSVAFPPQAALFFVSFGFLVPGLILLPTGLKELKVYRAIQSAELWQAEPPGSPTSVFAAGVARPGGLTVARF